MRSKSELTSAIRQHSRAVLMVNIRSRRAAKAHPRLAGLLTAAGLRLIADLPATDPATLPEVLERALTLSPDLLIFGGGDSSVATAVDFLAYRDVALGVLPLGTTNNFARSLGLPLTVDGAVRTIATGKVADVDLGRVSGAAGEELFANLVSLGLSVDVAHRTPHGLKRRIGRAAYALTGLRVLPRHRPFLATVTTAAATETFWTHQLNIANGRFHAGRAIARDASIDDRQLVIYRLGNQLRRRLSTVMLVQRLRGARRDLVSTPFLVTSEVLIRTDPVIGVDVDGEVRGTTPVTISTAAEALRVLVPRTFVDT